MAMVIVMVRVVMVEKGTWGVYKDKCRTFFFFFFYVKKKKKKINTFFSFFIIICLYFKLKLNEKINKN